MKQLKYKNEQKIIAHNRHLVEMAIVKVHNEVDIVNVAKYLHTNDFEELLDSKLRLFYEYSNNSNDFAFYIFNLMFDSVQLAYKNGELK